MEKRSSSRTKKPVERYQPSVVSASKSQASHSIEDKDSGQKDKAHNPVEEESKGQAQVTLAQESVATKSGP